MSGTTGKAKDWEIRQKKSQQSQVLKKQQILYLKKQGKDVVVIKEKKN